MKPSIAFIRLTLDCSAAAIVTGLAIAVVLVGIVLLVNNQTAATPPGCGSRAMHCGVQNITKVDHP